MNVLERLTATTPEGEAINAEDVRLALNTGHSVIQIKLMLDDDKSFDELIDLIQLSLYYRVLDAVGGNHTQAALKLRIGRTTLHKHIERLKQRTSQINSPGSVGCL